MLVHAGIADLRMWDDQIPALAGRYRVVRYDMRGFGRSSNSMGPYAHYTDLKAVIDALGLEQPRLVGCSKGGGAVLDFALQYPGRARALVLSGTVPGGYQFSGEPPAKWNEIVAAFRAGDLARTAELDVEFWVDGPRRSPEQVDAAVRERVRAMDLIALTNEASAQGREQPLDPPAAGRLGEVSVPVLVIVGELDDRSVVLGSQYLAAGLPNARYVVMPGTAHVPNMERPQEFNQLVGEFLSTQGTDRR